MITLTDKGAEKVREFLAAQGSEIATAGLRVGVRGGGCSGFQYALAFDQQRDGDETRSTTSTICREQASRSTTRT
jgi:iron-sulfur cluster assembly protein